MKRESEIFIIITILKWVRANEKYPETYVSRCYFLVGAGGFEPLFFRSVHSCRVKKCSIQATFRARHGTRGASPE